MTKFGYAIVAGFIIIIAGMVYLGYLFKTRVVTPATTSAVATSTPATTTPVASTSTATSTATGTIIYKNTEYGFSVELPANWEGHKIATGTVKFGQTVTLTPLSSKDDTTRMFVPVLIYPMTQWKAWEKNNFEDYPTAAPIGPTERARNADFVFATAPRYNFSFGTGTEEVENIVEKMKAF